MMKIKYLVIPFGILLLLGCSNPDYTPVMKEVLKPMQKELVSFYVKNKRYPISKEINTLLKKSGCKIKNNYCFYKGKRFLIESKLSSGYSVILKLKNSDCQTGLFEDGDIKVISCQNRGTTDLGQ